MCVCVCVCVHLLIYLFQLVLLIPSFHSYFLFFTFFFFFVFSFTLLPDNIIISLSSLRNSSLIFRGVFSFSFLFSFFFLSIFLHHRVVNLITPAFPSLYWIHPFPTLNHLKSTPTNMNSTTSSYIRGFRNFFLISSQPVQDISGFLCRWRIFGRYLLHSEWIQSIFNRELSRQTWLLKSTEFIEIDYPS